MRAVTGSGFGVRGSPATACGLAFAALAMLLGACIGDFDQRVEEAKQVNPGGGSTGTLPNPQGDLFIRGVISTAGAVRNASVTLRPVFTDGSVNWDDNDILGAGISFSNGIYQLTLYDDDYRGAILVQVRARVGSTSEAGNPATAISQKFHAMGPDHFLYSVVPMFDGYSVENVHVTPLTTAAVMRGMAFDGSIAGVPGGVGAGMFGVTCRHIARFFGFNSIRARLPKDFSKSGGFGDEDIYAFVLAALSQVAKDIGVANVWDFWLGMAQDAGDDGELNGSIGFVPNTGVPMPDLSQAALIGNALLNNYLDPNNNERVIGTDSGDVSPGGSLATLISELDTARTIGNDTVVYDTNLRIPDSFLVSSGGEEQLFIITLDQIGGSNQFEAYGDSAGPSFVEYVWTSSAPGMVDVADFGRVTVAPGTPDGNYTLSLTIRPAVGQTFVTGPQSNHSITVKVR